MRGGRIEIDFKIEGMKEIENLVERLGKVPQQSVSKAARAGVRVALRAAKSYAPRRTGTLRKSLKMVREKSRTVKKGKSVYQVVPDRKFNDKLVKISKDGNRSYYPASQEWGFKTIHGRIEGKHYLRRALEDNKDAIEEKILKTLADDLQKEIRKGGK